MSESVSLLRKAHFPIAVALSFAIIGAEVSCAGLLEGVGRSDRPAVMRELSSARRLVDHILRKSPRSAGPSEGAMAVRRSQLLQLNSALSAAEVMAASDLNTEVKVQTLRAYVTRTERLAASLGMPSLEPQGARKAREGKRISSPASDSAALLVTIDRGTLQQLKAQLALADQLASSS